MGTQPPKVRAAIRRVGAASARSMIGGATIVTTTYGELEGHEQDGVAVFFRVPFAAPPFGFRT